MLSKVGLLSGMLDTSPRLTIDAEPRPENEQTFKIHFRKE